jgi:hypothetical protein
MDIILRTGHGEIADLFKYLKGEIDDSKFKKEINISTGDLQFDGKEFNLFKFDLTQINQIIVSLGGAGVFGFFTSLLKTYLKNKRISLEFEYMDNVKVKLEAPYKNIDSILSQIISEDHIKCSAKLKNGNQVNKD